MLHITPIPAFQDNYIWALGVDSQVWLVDPGDGVAAGQWLAAHHKQLQGLLITHHHADHTGGIARLAAEHPGLPVYGPAEIDGITRPVAGGQHIVLAGLTLDILAVPAHTLDHIAYYLRPENDHPGALFCGDTLFAAGCGRLFEGSPAQLAEALGRFADLPPATLVCCAHEYTLANLAFARAADPDNPAVEERWQRANCQRQAGIPTLPSTLADELASNPFMRAHTPGVQAAVTRHLAAPVTDALHTLTVLRQWKDTFRG